jgi:hypothetical protein
MRRGGHYTFSTEYKGYVIRASFWGGAPKFTCDVIKIKEGLLEGEYSSDKEYADIDQLVAAIDRYDLKLRKDFSNRKAFRITGRDPQADEDGRIEEVEVTSIIDERMCWIKSNRKSYGSGREQERLADLFATKESVREYLKTMKVEDKRYKEVEAKAQAKLDQDRWVPMP